MQKMSPVPTFAIALEIQAGRIPVRWTVRERRVESVRTPDGKIMGKDGIERVFWPRVQINKWNEVDVTDIEDPIALRAEVFREFNTGWSEKAALSFLERVGAWQLAPPGLVDQSARTAPWGAYARIAHRHRFELEALVLPVEMEGLKGAIGRWYEQVGSPAKAKKAFQAAPGPNVNGHQRTMFAVTAGIMNTLPVSLEWNGKHPRAVIETLSGEELLKAAAWASILAGVPDQVCARCNTRFDNQRKKKFCLGDCAHLAAVQTYKRKKAAEKRAAKAVAKT